MHLGVKILKYLERTGRQTDTRQDGKTLVFVLTRHLSVVMTCAKLFLNPSLLLRERRELGKQICFSLVRSIAFSLYHYTAYTQVVVVKY